MYKKIKLCFINYHIRKIRNAILDIKDKMNWVREHKFDKDIIQVISELEYLDSKLRNYYIILNAYKRDKENILNKRR